MKQPRSGGGWQAIRYTLRKGRQVGMLRMWRAMRAKNVCKTCALGMGGQRGGMVNEKGHFPEVCKKSLQAQAADMRGSIPVDFWRKNTLTDLLTLTPKQAEDCGRLVYPLMYRPSEHGE